MIHSSQKIYLALCLLISAPLIAMYGGVAVLTQPRVEEQTVKPMTLTELLEIHKAFFVKKRAAFEQSKRRCYAPNEIDADEIEMMTIEAPLLKKYRKQGAAFVALNSDFEAWLINAFDRRSRFKRSLTTKKTNSLSEKQSHTEAAVQIQPETDIDKLILIEKAFHEKRKAEFENGTRKPYGKDTIDAEEIEMLQREELIYAEKLKFRLVFLPSGGSNYEGWLIRATDRRNRYNKWLKKQAQ